MNLLFLRVVRATAFLSLAAVAAQALGNGLVVVHDAGGTEPAAPHLERPALGAGTRERALERARTRLAERASSGAGSAFVPVKAAPLRAGAASRTRVRGLSRPVFAVGSDPASLAWLASKAARLRSSRAQGFLVSAPSAASAARARTVARRLGLSLDPMPGAAVADAYGARSYPFVAEPSP